jgi:hypothetical protein
MMKSEGRCAMCNVHVGTCCHDQTSPITSSYDRRIDMFSFEVPVICESVKIK